MYFKQYRELKNQKYINLTKNIKYQTKIKIRGNKNTNCKHCRVAVEWTM